MLYAITPRDSMLRETIAESEANTEVSSVPFELPEGAFPPVSLTAKAAYVYDLNTGREIFAKNAEAQLPLASITKLMTVLVAAEVFGNKGLVTITPDAFLDDPAHSSLTPSEHWLPKDIFTYTLVQSSNEGARAFAYTDSDYALARERFIDLMNEKAKALGLTQTYFLNETGLDETLGTGGSYGSAKDMAVLMGELIKTNPSLLEGTRISAIPLTTLDATKHIAINTNTDLSNLPGLIASKTGYTDLAGGNLIVAFDPGIGRPVMIVVLGSTIDGRFDDVRSLLNASLEYFGNPPTPEQL
jgi:D-alanyl-D-alanine carboxypeptidase